MRRRNPLLRIVRWARWGARTFIGRPAADALRGLVRCLFPVGSLLLWFGLIFSDQGKDVLRHVVEALSPGEEFSLNDATFLGFAAIALGLSIWYTMRWMLTVQLAGVCFRRVRPGWFRVQLPRAAGAAVPMLVAVCVLRNLPSDCCAAEAPVRMAGYLMGASFVAIAAAMFAFFVGRRRVFRRLGQPTTLPMRAPLPTETKLVLWWGSGVLVMLALIFTLVPLAGPRVVGSAAAPALAIAAINLIGTLVLTYLPMKRGVPSLAVVVLVWAVLAGLHNDNHTLRDAPDARYPAAERADLKEALWAWLAAQGVASSAAHSGPDRVYPVIIVASEGGGIRAAYWTAAVLDRLHEPSPVGASFDAGRHVFALSGVSGGSLGLASWLAVRRGRLCSPPASAEPPSDPPTTATVALSRDFLSPALAGLFYYDLMQSFWPWPYPWFDRSRGLEEGWQRAHSQVPGRPFEHTLGALYAGCPQLPLLFMNTTVVETGKRGIMAPVSLTFIKPPPGGATHWGRDVEDLMDAKWTTATQPLSGLVHHSARFPIVSPPGSVEYSEDRDGQGGTRYEGRHPEDRTEAFRRHHQPHTRMRLVDGGYFDNSGIQTALDLFIALSGLQEELKKEVPGVQLRPVLLVISNSAAADPGEAPKDKPPPELSAPRLLHDLFSPVRALVGVRDSHTRIMLAEAQMRFGPGNVIKIPMPANAKGADPALGWSLSRQAVRFMDDAALDVVQKVRETVATAACSRTSASDVCEPKP